MTYKQRLNKLDTLNKFINGKYQDDILLMLDKKYNDDKWSIICAVMHWFRVVKSHLNSDHLLDKESKDYNWGNVYLYIASVDIITKGINDIDKILTGRKGKLFWQQHDIFHDSNKDDNDYFQNIRAIFGAHPTNLDSNEYIVATYPTPYDKNDLIYKGDKKWDYYTLLWSKEKTDYIKQEEFGFSFQDTNNYLDKYLQYLDIIYKRIKDKIKEYKVDRAKETIEISNDPIKQLKILKEEDTDRLNGRYEYQIRTLITLISTTITNKSNEKKYSNFKQILIKQVPLIYEAIQNPNSTDNVDFIDKITECDMQKFDDWTIYYYCKLNEFYYNTDMQGRLINYFKNKIAPFKNKIANIKELYCLVKAFNYYNRKNK